MSTSWTSGVTWLSSYPEGLRQGTRSARMNTISFVAKSIFSMLKIKITWKTSLSSTSDWFLWRIWCCRGRWKSVKSAIFFKSWIIQDQFCPSLNVTCAGHTHVGNERQNGPPGSNAFFNFRNRSLASIGDFVSQQAFDWKVGNEAQDGCWWASHPKPQRFRDGCFMDGLVTCSKSKGCETCHALLGSWHRDESKVEHQVHVICHLVFFTIRWKLRLELHGNTWLFLVPWSPYAPATPSRSRVCRNLVWSFACLGGSDPSLKK